MKDKKDAYMRNLVTTSINNIDILYNEILFSHLASFANQCENKMIAKISCFIVYQKIENDIKCIK